MGSRTTVPATAPAAGATRGTAAATPTAPGAAAGAGTITDLLQRAARSSRGVRFVQRAEDPPVWCSYSEIHDGARAVAGALQGLGVRAGQRVALVLPTGPDFYHAFFGTMLAGAVPVPMYPPLRLGRLEEYHEQTARMLRAVDATLVLTDARVGRLLGPSIARGAPRLGWRLVGELAPQPLEPCVARADELALIQFSSGTTAQPKPIRLTHRHLIANSAAILAAILAAYPERDGLVHSAVSWLPLYHDMGLIGCVLAGVAHPGDLTLIPPEQFVARPALWLRTISRYRGTVSAAPDFAYALCADRVRDEELQGVDLSCWRVALDGAEPVTPATLERFIERFTRFGLRREALAPVYGLAEATLGVSFASLTEPLRWRHFDRDALTSHAEARVIGDDQPRRQQALVSLGRPLPGVQIEIVDVAGRALPALRLGRVRVRGPSVMEGYHDLPAETRAVLSDGWLDTGDTGFFDERGELYLYGRVKDIIVLRGRNYAPQAIEQACDGVPGVRTGCVVALGVPDTQGREQLVLLVERARDAKQPTDELARQISAAVTACVALVPDRVLVLQPGTLPRTSSGKLRRGEARRRYLTDALQPPAPVSRWRLLRELLRSRAALRRVGRGR